MALIEKQIVDLVELVQSNHIQVRTANIIEKDGIEIARTFHRHVLAPGDSVINEDAKVQAIANAIWTPEVVAAYQSSLVRES
jgi:hypothetical protein